MKPHEKPNKVGQMCSLVKITATWDKKGFGYSTLEVKKSDDYYTQASSPFFQYIYNEIENMKGVNHNETTEN